MDRTLEGGDRVTQFEALTAAAYWEFARPESTVAVVEAGLGGRYDATSVIAALGPGADQREPRAHALARPDGAPHRGGEAGRRAGRWDARRGQARRDALAVAERIASERGTTMLLLGGTSTCRRKTGRSRSRPAATPTTVCACACAASSSTTTSPSRWRRPKRSTGRSIPRSSARRHRVRPRTAGGRCQRAAHDHRRRAQPGRSARAGGGLGDITAGRRTVAVMSVLDDKDASEMLGDAPSDP